MRMACLTLFCLKELFRMHLQARTSRTDHASVRFQSSQSCLSFMTAQSSSLSLTFLCAHFSSSIWWRWLFIASPNHGRFISLIVQGDTRRSDFHYMLYILNSILWASSQASAKKSELLISILVQRIKNTQRPCIKARHDYNYGGKWFWISFMMWIAVPRLNNDSTFAFAFGYYPNCLALIFNRS